MGTEIYAKSRCFIQQSNKIWLHVRYRRGLNHGHMDWEETPQKGQSGLLAKGNFLAFFRKFPHHRLGRAPLFRMRVAFFQLTWISKIYLFHPMERFQIAETYSGRFKENIFCCGYLFATIVRIHFLFFSLNLKNRVSGFYSLRLKLALHRKK